MHNVAIGTLYTYRTMLSFALAFRVWYSSVSTCCNIAPYLSVFSVAQLPSVGKHSDESIRGFDIRGRMLAVASKTGSIFLFHLDSEDIKPLHLIGVSPLVGRGVGTQLMHCAFLLSQDFAKKITWSPDDSHSCFLTLDNTGHIMSVWDTHMTDRPEISWNVSEVSRMHSVDI